MVNQPWPVWIRSGGWRGSNDSSIPLLPALAHEAVAIAADSNVTIAQLARVVSKDPALATRVIRLANAAYCAPLQTVTTITEAIVRIGTAGVRNLVITVCLAARGSDAKVYGPSGRDQIDHAIGTAYMAHLVAEQVGWSQDEAFLGGLLHDVGKLLLLKLAHDYERWNATPIPKDELEDVLTKEHATIGGALLRSFQFPRHLVEGVMWHHEPLLSPTFQREAEVIYFADRLSHRYAFGCVKDDTPLANDVQCPRVPSSEQWIQSIDERATGLYAVARRILG